MKKLYNLRALDPSEYVMDHPNCIIPDSWMEDSTSQAMVRVLCTNCPYFNPNRKIIDIAMALVQPRKTRPYITERLLMGHKESNQTKVFETPLFFVTGLKCANRPISFA